MSGQQSNYYHHRGGGRGRGVPPPPSNPQSQFPPPNFPLNPNFLPFQNPNLHNPYLQNPNLLQFPFQFQQQFHQNPPLRPHNDAFTKADQAVARVRQELLAAGESVSAWKASQAALMALQVPSWESLGLSMHQVPSLYSLIVTEGKVNEFINCFIAVRKFCSLHELELELCKNEGVKQFEELKLGPLLKYPLVMQYFSLSCDVTEPFKITTVEIISYLHEFTLLHKEVKVDEFLDFISTKRSLTGKEKLNVRIQDLGRYITRLKGLKLSEETVMNRYIKDLKTGREIPNRPFLSKQKKEMDEQFSALTNRIKTFTTTKDDQMYDQSSELKPSNSSKIFSGKHILFVSTSEDEDEEEEDDDSEDEMVKSQNVKKSDRISSCPYPSAIEERTRLGLKDEVIGNSSVSVKNSSKSEPTKRKRKYEHNNEDVKDVSVSSDSFKKKRSRNSNGPTKSSKSEEYSKKKRKKSMFNGESKDVSVSDNSIELFITTWKEACRENDIDEVFDRMLQSYKVKKVNKFKRYFSTYPFRGLLNVAVTSIKRGMWDSMYDSMVTFGQQEKTFSENLNECISIDVEQEGLNINIPVQSDKTLLPKCGVVTIDDIILKITAYLEANSDDLITKSLKQKKINFLRKLCKCESWLIKHLSIDVFESLGFGEFLMFLDKHIDLLPKVLQNFLKGDTDTGAKVSLEVYLQQFQLDVLISQALNSLWGNEDITREKIFELLRKQFPLISFKIVENESMVEYSKGMTSKGRASYNCVLFSSTLLKGKATQNENNSSEIIEKDHKTQTHTSKEAIEVLVKAPMLTDLELWSHWELIFAPSLGSFIEWLIKEVNVKDLLFLVISGGKVIRVDNSATMDSFLEALLQGSSFNTAVQFVSLFAVYGGEQNVPKSLLKCHIQRAFEVFIKNSVEIEMNNEFIYKNSSTVKKVVPDVARFILDCLSYLPIEFCSFVGELFLSALHSFVKDAESAILSECKQIEQRVILHQVGFSLGVMEWINDYNEFSSSSSSLISSSFELKNDSTLELKKDSMLELKESSENKTMISMEVDQCVKNSEITFLEVSKNVVMVNRELNKCNNRFEIIETIRREEFGLDPNNSDSESIMLKKQHARLGRALHCLSQELYSQDSHFLLELVQNADDNVYQEDVEPTLTFILQEKGIIVLNNEQGFSEENIRALCDVGNSTKKGHNTGYIGKKGIGFKSVFRITNAPEIHSNGFHIKFDITDGQIGFVLPTVIPPCDVDLYSKLVCTDTNTDTTKCWNTCVVLPFSPNLLSGGLGVNSIISMFSDLHPSLLLFLHRLKSITFRNMLSDTHLVMKKQALGNGVVKVFLGDERMNWLVSSQKLKGNIVRPDVESTEISIAFTLKEIKEGEYIPELNQQPVFAFLPLRTYGLKFIIQGDFVLPSSREEVDSDSPWNQWLLSEFPKLFVDSKDLFCNLPCFKTCPGKAVSAFMSFVPLIGEVHGFFSSLPRMIISKLRLSNCLLLDNNDKCECVWVPPCKVIRNWTEKDRVLLPDRLISDHLGLGFLNKDVFLSDSLASALGVEEYGPKILLQILCSLCGSKNGLNSMGLGWLGSWLSAFYVMTLNTGIELDTISNLRKLPLIPLSNNEYCSLDDGIIWLHSDSGLINNENVSESAFPKLYSQLRTVSPALFSIDKSITENITRMLLKIGVQELSVHDIMKSHVLPAISEMNDKDLMIEYLAFSMFHLYSTCSNCVEERDFIITELRKKALILTNHGYKRVVEVPIHFSKEFLNPIDVKKLIIDTDLMWHEVDLSYLKHSVPGGVLKWRTFLQELGVTDFVQIVEVEKNISEIPQNILKYITTNHGLISMDLIAKDWESEELICMLSYLSSKGDKEKCKYFLEILDTIWNDWFSNKVTASIGENKLLFNSSVIRMFNEFKWMVSSMNDELHYPKDLFHDCVTVRSILGDFAPYAVPKVRSEKLLKDIGLKTEATLDDLLSVVKKWRSSEITFKASISQMSKFYSIIWSEMGNSKVKVIEELKSGPFIFVPFVYGNSSPEKVVPGAIFSPEEVYWNDLTGSMDRIKESVGPSANKTLCHVYPTLKDFFVNECGVNKIPPSRSYLQVLLQLSAVDLPSQAAKTFFQIFLRWSEDLRSGSLTCEDVEFLKESLMKEEFTVLPTELDKWVSLNECYGLVCWSDDAKLKKEFKNHQNIDFLYFGDLNDQEKEILHTKFPLLMQKLGILALTQVVTREAIYYGSADSNFKGSLVNWALPFAQRYIYNLHPNLKQLGFENLKNLQIIVVEKLFYKNIIKDSEIASNKRHECNCLLQGNILYTARESDSHSMFLELSRVFFKEPELHMANFLHMITTMVESGSTEEQTEFFILNSQKIPKIPDGEDVWSISLSENESLMIEDCVPPGTELIPSNKRKANVKSKWPPSNWNSAPGFKFAVNNMEEKNNNNNINNISDEMREEDTDFVVMEDYSKNLEIQSHMNNVGPGPGPGPGPGTDGLNLSVVNDFSERDQLSYGTPSIQQAQLTGRMGEFVAYQYFVNRCGGETSVRWVNETTETGLPYDLIVGEEYIEVKATKSERKDWFNISTREWKFAMEKGESFSIAHVVLSVDGMARVTTYKNPIRLCQQGKLQLAVMMTPKQQQLGS